MIFNRNRRPRLPDAPANRFVNRILTYGLVFFVIYTLANNSSRKNPITSPEPGLSEINYTPINWRDYVMVTNLQSGGESLYNFAENDQLVLEITPEDVRKIKAGAKSLPVYELKFDSNAGCSSIYQPISH